MRVQRLVPGLGVLGLLLALAGVAPGAWISRRASPSAPARSSASSVGPSPERPATRRTIDRPGRHRAVSGWFRRGLLVGVAAAVAGGLAQEASAKTVPVPWEIVVETVTVEGACSSTAYLQISEVAGAVSYAVDVVDSATGSYTFTGPPFSGDVVDTLGEIVRAPGGTHRWALSSFGGPPGWCATAAGFLAPTRWTVTRAVATLDDKLRVVGSVRDGDGKGVPGVRVSASGPKGGSATTDAAGSYAIVVGKGSYTVSAAGGLCVVGKPGCTRSVKVSLPPSRTVDFGPPPEHTLSGTVVEQECDEVSCVRAGLAGVTVRATGGPGGPEEVVTGEDGTYSLELAEGPWRVEPSLADRVFEHADAKGEGEGASFASVWLDGDRTGIDFQTCVDVPSGPAAAREPAALAKTTGGCLRISGMVTRRDCIEDLPLFPGQVCHLVVRAAPERAVVLRGPNGTVETETDGFGQYSAIVKPGRWVVHVPGPSKSVRPASRVVVVTKASVRGVDFNLCKLPVPANRIVGSAGCELVRIDGTAVDIDGVPLPDIVVAAEPGGDRDRSDANGRFVLHALAGRFTVEPFHDEGRNSNFAPLAGTRRVFTTDEDVSDLQLRVLPHVEFIRDTTFGRDRYTRKRLEYWWGGIPMRERNGLHTVTLILERTTTTPIPPGCRHRKTVEISLDSVPSPESPRPAVLTPGPEFRTFCDGDYIVTLRGGSVEGRVLERQKVYFAP